MCGENNTTDAIYSQGAGSSPRVRGKQHPQDPQQPHRRLIPACAGKTLAAASNVTARAAHPRVCGENHVRGRVGREEHGSSPRVRGKLMVRYGWSDPDRFIPACAGKTDTSEYFTACSGVHPRVCGENVSALSTGDPGDGSSPRVRGKPRPSALWLT